MASGDALKLQMSYDDMPGADIRTEVNYSALPSSADKVMYPLALCYKIYWADCAVWTFRHAVAK